MSGPSNFDSESFKQDILKKFRDEMRQMFENMIAKVA